MMIKFSPIFCGIFGGVSLRAYRFFKDDFSTTTVETKITVLNTVMKSLHEQECPSGLRGMT